MIYWIVSWLFTIWLIGYILFVAGKFAWHSFTAKKGKTIGKMSLFFWPAFWPFLIIGMLASGFDGDLDLDDFDLD